MALLPDNKPLTDSLIRGLEPPFKRSEVTWDNKLKGFGVEVTKNGSKSFVVTYRIDGRQYRPVIGKCDLLTTTAARDKARAILVDAVNGINFLKERAEKKTAPRFADLVRYYLEGHATTKSPKSQKEDQRLINRFLLTPNGRCVFGNKPLTEIDSNDITKLRSKLSKTPAQFNRLRALVSKMFNLAIEKDWINKNPAKGVPLFPEEQKDRHLPIAELNRLFEYLRTHPNKIAAQAIMLLVLIGCRKTELLQATWDEFDLEKGIWTKPSSHTKQRKKHIVQLGSEALTALQHMQSTATSPYVFPSPKTEHHLKDLKRFWEDVRKNLWANTAYQASRIYDLRHSFATLVLNAGGSIDAIGSLMGHSDPRTTMRYAKLLPEKQRELAEKVGSQLKNTNPETS